MDIPLGFPIAIHGGIPWFLRFTNPSMISKKLRENGSLNFFSAVLVPGFQNLLA